MSPVYTRADFQGVVDGIAAGHYTADGGWIETVALDRAERRSTSCAAVRA